MSSIVDEILALFRERGSALYFGEAVTEAEHALQCAALARGSGAPDVLVAAALLHDIGHLLHGLGEDIAEHGVDAGHESVGASWLERSFVAAVVDPVRLHVPAKRYLCAVEPEYPRTLSPASVQSLRLQGGPFSVEEARAFEREPFFREAVAVRRWDDRAKVPGAVVPGPEAYRRELEAGLREGVR